MPTTRTAKKRLRQNSKRRVANRAALGRMRTEVKKAEERILAGPVDKAGEQLRIATRYIDKAAKMNLIHPNKAARMKSSLAKKLTSAAKQ
ncbi:MAG: 30S ribosomal protein S20 [Planctomycetota bacterium]|jgi:small subunit ribosomal protein S20